MKLGGNLLGQTCFPFLEIALTKAWNSVTVIWKMKESQHETDCETSFRTLAGISSGPHAFLGFNCDSCLKTPVDEIC